MTVPLPPDGDTSWLDWAQFVHNRITAELDSKAASAQTGAGSQVVESSKVAGDTTNRYERRADGSIAIGPGGSTPLRAGEAFFVLDVGASAKEGVRIYGSSTTLNNVVTVFDHLGAPIFSIPVDGGPAVLGDSFRIFGRQDGVFYPRHMLHHDGSAQINKGDAGGSVGGLAIGASAIPPTRSPDGSAAGTLMSNVLWVDADGRLWSHRGSGGSQPIGGAWSFTSPPTAGVRGGDDYFNTGEQRIRYYDGAVWRRPALADRTKRTVAANYTLVAADALDRALHSTAAAAVTITLPQDSAAAIAQEVAIPWRQYGAGQVTFAAGTGATVVGRGGLLKSAGQYAEGTVTKVDVNTWLVAGDTVA